MTSDPLNQIELISTLSVPRYAPRLKPTPIPGANWNDTPLFCLKLNDEWVSHVLGVLTALDQPDTWVGTAEQIYAARQQVNEIMVAFMTMCDDCEVQFRIEDCELQWRESEADEWISLGNVCGADGVDGSDGEPGPPGADGEDGAPGAPGAPGADGADCDCTDYTHVPTPDNPPDTSDNETACNIAGGLTSYLRTKQAQAIEAGRSTVELVIAIEGLAAAIAAAIFTGGAAWPLIVAAAAVLMNVLIAADGAETDAMMADDAFWQAMSCSIYCALKPDKDITEAKQAEIAAAIRATDYTSGSYDAPFFYGTTADFFGALPNEVIRKSVTVGAMISYDCSTCDDCPDCDIESWVHSERYSGLGSVVGYGSDYVEVQSSYSVDFGAQAIGIISLTSCCTVESIDVIDPPNGAISSFNWYCGSNPEAGADESHVGNPNNALPYTQIILYGGTDVFTYRIHLTL